MQLRHATVETPVGLLLLIADGTALREIRFESDPRPAPPGPERSDGVLAEAAAQLAAYFRGELRRFDLPLAPAGTPFQRRVWDELRRIPYGASLTYGELASRVGKPTGARAVGAANGKNPLPIVIPCHRVVGRHGSLTGFGGGLPIKRRLLELESATPRLAGL